MSGFENQLDLTPGEPEGSKKLKPCTESTSTLCHLLQDPAQRQKFEKVSELYMKKIY